MALAYGSRVHGTGEPRLSVDDEVVSFLRAEPGDTRPGWGAGRGVLFAAGWLVFLVPPTVESASEGLWGLVALLVVFSIADLALWYRWGRIWVTHTPFTAADLAMLSLFAVMAAVITALGGQSASGVWIYVVVLMASRVPVRLGLPVVLVVGATHEVATRVIPGWQPDHASTMSLMVSMGFAIVMRMTIRRRVMLDAAREENHLLALEAERNRMARDVHDILGHSLTVLTVKAELAGRLLDHGGEAAITKARQELADMELLARDALGDVRRTVEGYREISLTGELTSARRALLAAQIEPDLPTAVDDVSPDLRELFAWALREGVTNVVRHSGATRCRVTLGRTRLTVEDDGGRDGANGPAFRELSKGRGLEGLRLRADQAGAHVRAGRSDLGGFRLDVEAVAA